MITPKDKIGYIRRATLDGKEQFKFIEAKIKSVRANTHIKLIFGSGGFDG